MAEPAIKQDVAPLTETERLKLGDLEIIIERGMQTFVEVGAALMQIREQRLYRATYSSFEDYCQERWGWSSSRARQLIGATEVVRQFESVTPGNTPVVERHARELVSVEPEARPEVYAEAQADAAAEGTPLATRHIREAKKRREAPPPRAPEPEPNTGTTAEDHEPDPIEEWERAEEELAKARELIEALQAGDLEKRLTDLHRRYGQLEGRLNQEMRTRAEAEKDARYAKGKLKEVREALGVASDREIIPAIRALRA